MSDEESIAIRLPPSQQNFIREICICQHIKPKKDEIKNFDQFYDVAKIAKILRSDLRRTNFCFWW